VQPAHASAEPTSERYRRRRAGRSALYRIIDEHYRQTLAETEEQGSGYPAFVRTEFERYLLCGRLSAGFSRLVCKDCGFNHLLAFSCKGRLCPSCANRRMEQTALVLCAKLLPKLPYRQWTLALPWRIRWQLGTRPKLLGAALSLMLRSIFAWQRRRARRAGITEPLCASVTFVHRFNSQLLLSPHFHALLPDGVLHRDGDGPLRFEALPPPQDHEVRRLLERIGSRIEALLQGAADDTVDDDDLDAHQLCLAEAATPPRRRPWQSLTEAAPPPRARCAQGDGYSLHADVAVAAEDRSGLQRLLRYGARPALAAGRVSLSPQGMVVYQLRKPTATGQTQLVLTPQQFIRRLAALTPPPWLNLIRFHGVFASASGHRQGLVELLAEHADPDDDPCRCPPLRHDRRSEHDAPEPAAAAAAPQLPQHLRVAWSELLRRTFADPLVCPRCQGRMRLVAVIKDPKAIAAILANPHHRDDDPDAGPDPPLLPLPREPQLELLDPA